VITGKKVKELLAAGWCIDWQTGELVPPNLLINVPYSYVEKTVDLLTLIDDWRQANGAAIEAKRHQGAASYSEK
jgi:hypothetical protein